MTETFWLGPADHPGRGGLPMARWLVLGEEDERAAGERIVMDSDYVELTAADLAHRWRERTVLESVDEAVAEAGDTEEYAHPESALRWLLSLAWHDLEDARQRALNGRWSIECSGQVTRIIGLTRLVGPLPWQEVPVDLILDGVYERIHELIGILMPLSEDDWRRAREVKDGRPRSPQEKTG